MSNSVTSAFIDLATYDEIEKYLYGGRKAVVRFVRCVKKSTWFSQVPVTLRITSGQANFGQEFSANISRAGDYLLQSWMRAKLPEIQVTDGAGGAGVPGTDGLRFCRNLMHNVVKETWLSFNDLTAETFDNYWMDSWRQHTLPESKFVGYSNMIGNVDALTAQNVAGGLDIVQSLPASCLNLPLPFFYTRDSGVSLPTAAIPYNEMKLNFDLRDWTELLMVTHDGGATWQSATPADIVGGSVSFDKIEIWSNYAVVSNEERVKMGKCPRDIVIEQVQSMPRQEWDPAVQNGRSFDLRFSHAVKSLHWMARNKGIRNEWSNYTASTQYDPTGVDPILQTTLTYENTDRLHEIGSDYFSFVNPFYHWTRIPTETGYHSYAYSMCPEDLDPQGSTNYGKLTNVTMTIEPTTEAVQNAHKYDFVVRARNNNIVRVSGGALGFPVL